MKPLSTGDSGVITPDTAMATADAATQSALGAVPVDYTDQAILDVPLMQLPEDVVTAEDPVFTLAQKITEETQQAAVSPAGLSGLSGLGTGDVDAQDILSGVSADASAALSGVQTVVGQAAGPALAAAQTAFDQAKSAFTGASTGGTGTSGGAANSAAATTLTEDPVAALMNGISIPALPGIDTLFDPILQLLNSFGTGVFGSLDPTSILSQSSSLIESAMTVAQGGLKTVQQLWEGEAADAATTASQQAQVEGQETSQRGFDIAALTEQAAAVVQSGNAQLSAIATTFAAQATALAPTIMLPPTQATLIGLATEHLGSAVTVVNTTRGQLAGHTAQLNGAVSQLAAQSGLPSPEEALSAVSENIGEPLLTQAESALSGTGDDTTAAAATGTGSPTTTPGSTSAAGLGTGGTGGSGGGSGAALGALGTARGGSGGSAGGGGTPSTGTPKATTAVPGATVPGGRVMTAGMGTGIGLGTTTGTGTGGSGFMGGGAGAGAGQRNNDDEHGRTVQPYQSRTGNDDLTGPLGESTPEVIGAVHEDERDADEDRF
ncbi:hypothetical protein [Nocardia neocaledoniensis]|uniref:hypothetical protein n=1 Tax=Nocardia neocaledoniensis TaxID=236511 RepID=UPI002455B08B|nr:hypothetical protein [Nocardia neocaledoniensis]